ncbi:MAG: phage integrase SAM-like domain-containing protein [Pilosibacter sp.]
MIRLLLRNFPISFHRYGNIQSAANPPCSITVSESIPHYPGSRSGKLSQVTNHVVKEFLNGLRQDSCRLDGKGGVLTESSITKYRATISTVLSYAVEEGYIPINPLIYAGKQRGRGKVKREYKTKQLTLEQAKQFLWILDHLVNVLHKAHTVKRNGKPVQIKEYTQLWSLDLKWQLFFYIAFFTGARRGEIVSLLWSEH